MTQPNKDPHGVFAELNDFFDKAQGTVPVAAPFAIGSTIARGAVPAFKWLTDRVVGGGSMLSGPVSKITQVPVKDIVVRASDHPDAINPLKVQEIQGLMTKTPSRLPAVELLRQGNQYILKDGRHRFTAAQGLGLENVPAIISK